MKRTSTEKRRKAKKSIRNNFLDIFPKELEQTTWKICTQKYMPRFGKTHKLFQRPTGTRRKSRSTRAGKRSPQQKGGIMFSTKSLRVAKKQKPPSKEPLFQLDFLFFSSLPRVKVFTSSFSVEYPTVLYYVSLQ